MDIYIQMYPIYDTGTHGSDKHSLETDLDNKSAQNEYDVIESDPGSLTLT